ncbi:glycosyltransferase family 4 protein [Aquimarina latercula]|uniref:glycosyltransferase family 4 protein n=1 Tax=Aquimarina latercula TaxID=987 RepID=UPI0004178756|nr:glycosyltransferase family 4 protein [Aquimarina latercula]
MNILFVSSGNSKNGISSLTKNQGESIMELGHQVTFFTIKGKGAIGYFKNIFTLNKFLKNTHFDVVHAHYSLSAIVASLAGAKPLIVSLMGSDVKASAILKYVIKLFSWLFWKQVIVKSQDMKDDSGLKKANVIPNGVNFKKFKQIPRSEAIIETGWDYNKKHILFAANPDRPEKNFALAKKAFSLIDNDEVILQKLEDIPNKKMPFYFNASDVILLTSLWEGSPNVIKEAMACNCKIVAVNVGDIKQVISSTKGCFVTKFDPKEISEKIKEALNLEDKTKGRANINYLDSELIAHQLVNVYKNSQP